MDACVKAMQEATGGAPVSLLAHSAGGWLARVYLLGFGTAGIDRLVTLGSPHQPPPKAGLTAPDHAPTHTALVQPACRSGLVAFVCSSSPAASTSPPKSISTHAFAQAQVRAPTAVRVHALETPLTGLLRAQEGVAFTVDQTRGILTHVTETCPGRFHNELEYITVAGKFIKGAGIREPGTSFKTQASLAPVQLTPQTSPMQGMLQCTGGRGPDEALYQSDRCVCTLSLAWGCRRIPATARGGPGLPVRVWQRQRVGGRGGAIAFSPPCRHGWHLA